jgi:hypothetical protein
MSFLQDWFLCQNIKKKEQKEKKTVEDGLSDISIRYIHCLSKLSYFSQYCKPLLEDDLTCLFSHCLINTKTRLTHQRNTKHFNFIFNFI